MASDSTPAAPCEMPSSGDCLDDRSLSVVAGRRSETRVLSARLPVESWQDRILLRYDEVSMCGNTVHRPAGS